MTSQLPSRIEIQPPDIRHFRDSDSGTPYVHVLRSPQPGPTAMITSVIHGNEFSGAIVLASLLTRGFQPARGTLILAFCNVQAFSTFDETNPGASRCLDEDLNRVWKPERLRENDAPTRELKRALQLKPFIETADYLLDLHSMSGDSPPMALTGMTEKCIQFGKELGLGMPIVSDHGHENGVRMRDYGRFSDPGSKAVSLLVECGQHWRERTEQVAMTVTDRFLGYLGMTGASPAAEEPMPHLQVTDVITCQTDGFQFLERFQGLEKIAVAGTAIATDGEISIQTPYDNCHLIMPTHGASVGQTAVRLARELS